MSQSPRDNENNKKKKKDGFFARIARRHKRKNPDRFGKTVAGGVWSTAIWGAAMVDPTGICLMWACLESFETVAEATYKHGRYKRAFRGELDINGFSLKGKNKDLNIISSTQTLIKHLSNECEGNKLPADLQTEIAKHLNDLEEVFAKVKIYQHGLEVKTFTFERQYDDPTTGYKVIELIDAKPNDDLTINTTEAWQVRELSAKEREALALRKKAEAQKKEEAAKAKKFNDMAKKIEHLEEEVARLKGTQQQKLDKPKIKKAKPKGFNK